jgi:hypothetical protein
MRLWIPHFSTFLSDRTSHGCLLKSCCGLHIPHYSVQLSTIDGSYPPTSLLISTKCFRLSTYDTLCCLAARDFNHLRVIRRMSFELYDSYNRIGLDDRFPKVRAFVIVDIPFGDIYANHTRNFFLLGSLVRYQRSLMGRNPPLHR